VLLSESSHAARLQACSARLDVSSADLPCHTVLPNMQVNARASGRVVFSVDEYDAPHWPVVLLAALFLHSLQVALCGLQEPPTLLFPG
jgi:hypothetical protein